jgi:acyl carrier protein
MAAAIDRVATGVEEPPPITPFGLADAEDAFRFMAQARHIGKVVLRVEPERHAVRPPRDRTTVRADGTYLVSGGLGGFGLATARWLAARGARHLVLLSRSGVPRGPAEELDELRELADVHVEQVDVTDTVALAAVLDRVRAELPPLRGVVHTAMVLDDDTLAQLDADRVDAVLAPKLAGAWNLHRLTEEDPLELFVLYSSMASVFGHPVQANYAAANAFLDALAAHRRRLGRPGLAVGWGAMDRVGYVARNAEVARYVLRGGLEGMQPAQAWHTLDTLLEHDEPHLIAARIDWSALADTNPVMAASSRLRTLVSEATTTASGPDPTGARERLQRVPPTERPAALEDYVVDLAARVLGSAGATIDPDRPLIDHGFDSLMAVELTSAIRSELDVRLPVVKVLQGATAREFAALVHDHLVASDAAPSAVRRAVRSAVRRDVPSAVPRRPGRATRRPERRPTDRQRTRPPASPSPPSSAASGSSSSSTPATRRPIPGRRPAAWSARRAGAHPCAARRRAPPRGPPHPGERAGRRARPGRSSRGRRRPARGRSHRWVGGRGRTFAAAARHRGDPTALRSGSRPAGARPPVPARPGGARPAAGGPPPRDGRLVPQRAAPGAHELLRGPPRRTGAGARPRARRLPRPRPPTASASRRGRGRPAAPLAPGAARSGPTDGAPRRRHGAGRTTRSRRPRAVAAAPRADPRPRSARTRPRGNAVHDPDGRLPDAAAPLERRDRHPDRDGRLHPRRPGHPDRRRLLHQHRRRPRRPRRATDLPGAARPAQGGHAGGAGAPGRAVRRGRRGRAPATVRWSPTAVRDDAGAAHGAAADGAARGTHPRALRGGERGLDRGAEPAARGRRRARRHHRVQRRALRAGDHRAVRAAAPAAAGCGRGGTGHADRRAADRGRSPAGHRGGLRRDRRPGSPCAPAGPGARPGTPDTTGHRRHRRAGDAALRRARRPRARARPHPPPSRGGHRSGGGRPPGAVHRGRRRAPRGPARRRRVPPARSEATRGEERRHRVGGRRPGPRHDRGRSRPGDHPPRATVVVDAATGAPVRPARVSRPSGRALGRPHPPWRTTGSRT